MEFRTEEYLKKNGIISVKIFTEGTSAPVIRIEWVNGDESKLIMSTPFSDIDQCVNNEVKSRNIRFRKQKIEKIMDNLNGI